MLLRVGDDRVLGLHGQRFPGSVVYDLRVKDGRDVPFLNGLDDEPPPPADVVARRFQMVQGAAMGVRGKRAAVCGNGIGDGVDFRQTPVDS